MTDPVTPPPAPLRTCPVCRKERRADTFRPVSTAGGRFVHHKCGDCVAKSAAPRKARR
jgi:DNA-binding helix-hairpin-helix protein with protein kinase domain